MEKKRPGNNSDLSPESKLRIRKHRELSREIAALSDQNLLHWISESEAPIKGHAVLRCPESQRKVFVKILPLTRLDLETDHLYSTANYYGLPSYYHYRLGSSGFGPWRELAAHQRSNEWVLTGQCRQFPLLHGFRQLPLRHRMDNDTLSMKPWKGDGAIQRRVQLLEEAPQSLVLFLEFFPQTLGGQIAERLIREDNPVVVVQETGAALRKILSFLEEQDLLHMDLHFENVLSDGENLVLGDLGLAITPSFALDQQEEAFRKEHKNFDHVTAITSLAHSIVAHYDGACGVHWREKLREIIEGRHFKSHEIPEALRRRLEKMAPVALAIGNHYRGLGDKLTTKYPARVLQALIEAVEGW